MTPDGAQPGGPLLQAAAGNFYGTTGAGGDGYSDGTIFKLAPDGALTTIHVFTRSEGTRPWGGLVQGIDGNFYGTTGLGGIGGAGVFGGTIFKVTPGGTLTNLHVFEPFEGTPLFLALIPNQDGSFYGASAGAFSSGAIFRETPAAVPGGGVTSPGGNGLPTLNLEAAIPQVTAGGSGFGEFTLGLSAAQTSDFIVNFIVNYTIKGSAVNDTDYVQLTGTKKTKAGKTSKPIKIVPLGDLGGASKKTVVLTLAPGDGYIVSTSGKVKVKILAP